MNVLRRSVRRRAAERSRRSFTHLLALVVGLVIGLPIIATTAASPASAAPADDGTLRVLLFYKPNFHASHVQARQALRDLAGELGTQYDQPVEIQETDDPAVFTQANLATKDVLAFAQTGGVLFNEAQRTALEGYIRGGGGYLGLHYAGWSVGQSEHDVNPFYARLVGAASEGHPENPAVRSGRVVVKDAAHPLAQGLPASFTRSDEWYDWVVNPAPNVRTILEADESSYVTDASGGRQGTSHPITWCQQIDAGRSWYTGMGHEGSAYSEGVMRTQIKNGLAYAAGLLPADCSPPAKDGNGAWSGVTPWPLVPINASLTADGQVQTFGSVGSGCTDNTPYDWTGNDCVVQGGQMEFDVWDPTTTRTTANVNAGLRPNTTYTDLFCSMQVQDPHRRSVMTVGGDDGLGGNAPNDAAIGVTSYSKNRGMQNEAPMNYPRWYPTGTTMPNGDIVVQGGSLKGGPGGPGVLTPEIYTPDSGSGWKLLTGARSPAAYGDGGSDHAGQDENRWWYPRAFVTPGTGTLFNVTGTQMYELDPAADGGNGKITLRGTLPANVANQGSLGNPVGATSTATMYAPGKILQVGGGWWANGGGPAGARAAFTIDITGGTANPVVTPVAPMKYQRHWPTSTLLPNGEVLVTGGSRDNNGNAGYVTTAEIWNPETGQWRVSEVPHEHARLYHSSALLLPDGRVMVGGGGAPGPRNYTDVEFFSPDYLFNGNTAATRPTITSIPKKIGYDGTFQLSASGPVSRVTLLRNGSVTHGFNNDQNFQELEFTQSGNALTVTAPEDGTYAPPGAYMVYVWDAAGTPSVAKIVDIDPAVKMDSRHPSVVDQFEYPRLPVEWRGANPPAVIDVAPGNGRMAPWSVSSPVQLVRSTGASQGGLGIVGYHLGLGANGDLSRTLTGLDPGRDYRISLKYARDSRSSGTADGLADLRVGDLDTRLTVTTANPSQGDRTMTFKTFVGTFKATSRSTPLRLSAPGGAAGVMIDDLVVTAVDPGPSEVPVRYEFEEGTGTTVANTGTDSSVGPAVLTGGATFSNDGVFGKALDLPGGSNANAVDLPDNLLRTATDFTTSFWVRPDTKGNWIGMFHLGDDLGDAGSFFQIQMQTQAAGNTGLAATFKRKGSNVQERVYATPTRDVAANAWSHVVFTRQGATGTLYLNGEQVATRNNLTITMADLGPTANNWLGRNGYPDPALDGRMDDVRLYTSTLSAADVAQMYADGTAKRTTTTVTVSPASPSPFAAPLTVSATVAGEDATTPAGTAELWVDGARVGEPKAVTAGAVTFAEITLPPGQHSIEVRFTAAAGFRDSVKAVTHTVERPPPGEGVPIRYTFDEGTGTTAANTGSDPSVGAATLTGAAAFTANGRFGSGVNLPGGAAATANQVRLPDNIEAGMDEEFSVSVWARPNNLPNWVPLVQIGSSTDTFFLLQSSTQVQGPTGFAATFKAPGNATQERLTLGGGNDLPLNEWTHVVFTMSGSTGRLYFDGELVGTRNDFTLGIGDIGVNGSTTANLLGGTSWPDPRFNGLVDEFQMFGYELTADQVGDLYEGPAAPANTAPVGVADAYGTDQDQVLTVGAPGVLANDTDADDDTLTAVGLTQPAHGDVTLAATGAFTYTPEAGWHGTDTFTYRANDGTVDSAATTVTITVDQVEGPSNATPVAVDDTYVTDADVVLRVAAPGVLTNDTDADGDDLTATGLTQPTHGTVSLSADGRFTYTPDTGWSGVDTFTYRANDGTVSSSPATVSITVEEPTTGPQPNRAPVAVADVFLTQQDVPLVVPAPGVLGNDSDADGDELTAIRVNQTAHGTVTLGADGALRYEPDRGFSGYDTFVYKVNDGTVDSGLTTVTIAVDKAPPAATAIAAVASTWSYGQRGVVSVAIAPDTATGTVSVVYGSRTIARGTLKDGAVRIALPVGSVAPGSRTLTLQYAGDANHAASSTSLAVRTGKGRPSMTVASSTQVRVGQQAVVRVRLAGPGGVAVTGTVQVKVAGRTLTATVRNGAASFRLPKATTAGSQRASVSYRGSSTLGSATKTVAVRVVR